MYDGLQLRLLGPPQVILHGAPLTFSRRKAVALLAYVAMSGQPISREILADLLAGETTDDLARQHVRNALADLIGQLGIYLIVTRQAITFNRAAPFRLDVEEFQRLFHDDRGSGGGRALSEAAALYRGDLLAGFTLRNAPAFDEWLETERQRLRGLAVHAFQTLLDRAVDDDNPAIGLALADRLLAVDPLRETSYRQAMLLLDRSGQRERALDVYDRCRRILAAQLGVAPLPETTAIYERLHTTPSSGRPPNFPSAPERQHAMTRELAALVKRLADPECRLIVLVGPDSPDKTRLPLEAVAHYRSLAAAPDAQLFPDGIYLVSMANEHERSAAQAGARAGRSLADTIGAMVGAAATGADDPAGALIDVLADRSMLLVLDGLVPERSDVTLVAEILRRSPHVKLIVMAQETFNLQEEWVLDIE